MKAKLSIKLSSTSQLTIEGEGDGKSIIKNMSFWSQMPSKCSECGSSELSLSYRSPKGNDYFGLKCKKCTADLNFGQFKAGGFFIKQDEKFTVWSGKLSDNSKPTSNDEEPPSFSDSDVPF